MRDTMHGAAAGAGLASGAAEPVAVAAGGRPLPVIAQARRCPVSASAQPAVSDRSATITIVWLRATIDCDQRGYVLTGRDLVRATASATGWPLDRPPLFLETSLPGVFAAGDVRHRSVKRVASAVGEGAIAIQLAHEYLAEQAT